MKRRLQPSRSPPGGRGPVGTPSPSSVLQNYLMSRKATSETRDVTCGPQPGSSRHTSAQCPPRQGPRTQLPPGCSLFMPLGIQLFLVLKRPDLESRRNRPSDHPLRIVRIWRNARAGEVSYKHGTAETLVSMTTDSLCLRRKKNSLTTGEPLVFKE